MPPDRPRCPAQFRGGYGLPSSSAKPVTIAIVAAYDHPNIKADLDVYNRAYGLPVFPSCSAIVTTACFQKLDQRGGTAFPRTDTGWSLEIALDVGRRLYRVVG
jgi:subtilase family serine protease